MGPVDPRLRVAPRELRFRRTVAAAILRRYGATSWADAPAQALGDLHIVMAWRAGVKGARS